MRAMLELLARFFVNVRRTVHRINGAFGWKWNRTGDNCTSLFDGADDLFSRFVDQVMIVRLQFDSDNLCCHDFYLLPSSEALTKDNLSAPMLLGISPIAVQHGAG